MEPNADAAGGTGPRQGRRANRGKKKGSSESDKGPEMPVDRDSSLTDPSVSSSSRKKTAKAATLKSDRDTSRPSKDGNEPNREQSGPKPSSATSAHRKKTAGEKEKRLSGDKEKGRKQSRPGFEVYVPRARDGTSGRGQTRTITDSERETDTANRNASPAKPIRARKAKLSQSPARSEHTATRELTEAMEHVQFMEKELAYRRRETEREKERERERQRAHAAAEERRQRIEEERREKERKLREETIKKIQEQNIEKLARAELMYSLLQSHKASTETVEYPEAARIPSTQRGRSEAAGKDREAVEDTLPVAFSAAGKSASYLCACVQKWENRLREMTSDMHELSDDPMQEQATSCLRTAVREAYRVLVTEWLQFSHEKNLDQKLWANWYKEIETLQRKLKEAKDVEQNQRKLTEKEREREAAALGLTVGFSLQESSRLKDRLRAVISGAITYYSRLVQSLVHLYLQKREPEDRKTRLEDSSSSSPSMKETSEDLLPLARITLQRTLIAVGDLSRYSEQYSPSASKDWTIAEQHYWKALYLGPGNGKAFNQLAVIATYRRDLPSAMYLYFRALSATSSFPARENILSLVEKARQQLKKLPPLGKGASLEQCLQYFGLHVTATAGALFSHIDEEHFGKLLSRCLSTSSQMIRALEATLLDRVDAVLVSRGLESALGRRSQEVTEGNESSAFHGLLAHVAQILHRVLIISILLVHNSISAFGLREDGMQPIVSSLPADWQSAPPLVNALVMVLSISNRILEGCEHALQARRGTKERETGEDYAKRLLGPVLTVFDWLSINSELLSLDHPQMTTFRMKLVAVLSLIRDNPDADGRGRTEGGLENGNEGKNPAVIVEEDLEIAGLLPVEAAFKKRYEKEFMEDLKPSPSLSAKQHERVVRAHRFASFCAERGLIYRVDGKEHGYRAELLPSVSSLGLLGLLEPSKVNNATDKVEEKNPPSTSPPNAEDEKKNVTDKVTQVLDSIFQSYQSPSSPVRKPEEELRIEGSREDLMVLNPGNSASAMQQAGPQGQRTRKTFPLASERKSVPSSSLASSAHSTASSPSVQDLLRAPQALPLIVIDAPNVAMRHGLNSFFSCKGILLAFSYYRKRGHKVVGFLPDYYTRYEEVGKMRRMAKAGFEVGKARIPDDVSLLRSLVEGGAIVATPSQDYDDSYCIQYARTHEGCVVTNDLYRDHLEKQGGREEKAALRQWLKTHVISYTWVGDEFLPNPDFRFPTYAHPFRALPPSMMIAAKGLQLHAAEHTQECVEERERGIGPFRNRGLNKADLPMKRSSLHFQVGTGWKQAGLVTDPEAEKSGVPKNEGCFAEDLGVSD